MENEVYAWKNLDLSIIIKKLQVADYRPVLAPCCHNPTKMQTCLKVVGHKKTVFRCQQLGISESIKKNLTLLSVNSVYIIKHLMN